MFKIKNHKWTRTLNHIANPCLAQILISLFYFSDRDYRSSCSSSCLVLQMCKVSSTSLNLFRWTVCKVSSISLNLFRWTVCKVSSISLNLFRWTVHKVSSISFNLFRWTVRKVSSISLNLFRWTVCKVSSISLNLFRWTCVYEKYGQTDRVIPKYPTKTLFAEGITNKTNWFCHNWT